MGDEYMLNLFKKYGEMDIRNPDFIKSLYKECNLEYPKPGHTLNWSTQKNHLDFLHNMILALKPKIIIETGTFEGHGTYAIAAAAHINNNGARIFTHDYDGDPVQDESGTVSKESWLELRALREANIKKIQEKFTQCEVTFIDGDSRLTLPETLIANRKPVNQRDFTRLWKQSNDPSEGIRSGDLDRMLRENFHLVEATSFGGTLLHPFFLTSFLKPCRLNIQNWHQTEVAKSETARLVLVELEMIKSEKIPKNYLYYIFRKRN